MRVLRRHVSRRLFWALVISLIFHFAAADLYWLSPHHRLEAGLPNEIVSVTTTLRSPAGLRRRRRTRTRGNRTRYRRKHRRTRLRRRAAPRHELARIEEHAPVFTPPHSRMVRAQGTVDVAAQQVIFEKTIAQLRQQNDPVAGSQRPVQTSDSAKHFSYDFSESLGSAPHGEGILSPVQSWHEDGYDYYYVRYWVQYPDGTSETGIVPWPLRYLPGQDPFRLGIQHFPLPAPLADYSLPAGTSLHPLVAYCYEHRGEISSCPIYHD